MKVWRGILAFLALMGLSLLTFASAQDKEKAAKDDAKKEAVKKDDVKKDDVKKDDAKKDKDEPKKEDSKREKKEGKDDKGKDDKGKDEEKLVYGNVVDGKINRFASESSKDFTLEIMMPDPKKMYGIQKWYSDTLAGIFGERDPVQRARRMNNLQMEMAKKQANPLETHTVQDVEVRAVDKMVVRCMYPPLEYDDKGNLKRWTAKELSALKGKSRLPGYPSEYETLKPGHFVSAYFAKVDRPKGGPPKKKLDDDIELIGARPEIVMIVIKGEPTGR